MNSRKVIVYDISPSANEKTVKDFFLFCGKIKEFELIKEESSDKQIAYVTFERDTAAKTALMLTNAVIGDCQITVKPADDSSQGGDDSYDESGLSQEDKPKTAIIAEILAAGFQLQDAIITKAINFDAQYGLSNKVIQYLEYLKLNLKTFDDQYKIYDTLVAKVYEVNNKYLVRDKLLYAASQIQDKVNQAIETSTGQKVVHYYQSTTKQVADVRDTARSIADQKKLTIAQAETVQ